MPGIHRMFDINSGGGTIILPLQTNVFANFRLVAVQGSLVAPHAPCPSNPAHCAAICTPLSLSVNANFLPVIKDQDIDSCGDTRVMGSLDVQVGFV